jgi:hypothetical protein
MLRAPPRGCLHPAPCGTAVSPQQQAAAWSRRTGQGAGIPGTTPEGQVWRTKLHLCSSGTLASSSQVAGACMAHDPCTARVSPRPAPPRPGNPQLPRAVTHLCVIAASCLGAASQRAGEHKADDQDHARGGCRHAAALGGRPGALVSRRTGRGRGLRANPDRRPHFPGSCQGRTPAARSWDGRHTQLSGAVALALDGVRATCRSERPESPSGWYTQSLVYTLNGGWPHGADPWAHGAHPAP